MRINVTKEEETSLQNIWSEVLKNFPEDDVEKDMWRSIGHYVSNMGLPETAEHQALTGDGLEEYYEKNGGPNFED